MASELMALCFDAHDPPALAAFWAGVLGWERADDHRDAIDLVPNDDTGFRLRFLASQEPKAGPNRMHFDLTSASLEGQQETVAKALGLGARHIDVGQLPDEDHVVLADPEGNEFCVIEPGNTFLADCGFIGALSSDGSQEVGLLLEQGPGLAAGLGPRPGDGHPRAPRWAEDHLGRPAGRPEARQEPSALRPCSRGRQQPADRGRPPAVPGRHAPGQRPRRRGADRAG